MDTGIWESGESGTVSSQMLRDGSGIISPACGLGTKSPLTNIQAIRLGIRKATEEKLKSERKTVNYEMTMKNMKRENLLEKLRKKEDS